MKSTKRISLTIMILSIFLSISAYSQGIKVNILNSFGNNFIDFEKLMDAPFWDAGNSPYDTQITDSDRFTYKGAVQVTFPVADGIYIGGEVGINRLYYVEDRYSVLLNDDEFRWRTYNIWSLNYAVLGQFYLSNQSYFQSSAGLHTFLNGSGSALGVMAGGGYEFSFNDAITIPIDLRVDAVFGDQMSIIPSIGIGIKMQLGN